MLIFIANPRKHQPILHHEWSAAKPCGRHALIFFHFRRLTVLMSYAHLSFHAPVGDLTLFEEADALVALNWGWVDGGKPTALLAEAQDQLTGYFADERQNFSLPMRPAGTAFQQRVWAALQAIGYGKTSTYQALATQLASAARAVGSACGRNPLPILIPCHRVVTSSGGLGGYSGDGGIETKSRLLQLEGSMIL
jgi:methylated-DNA-[protein]-cysteine S-methyltransferase